MFNIRVSSRGRTGIEALKNLHHTVLLQNFMKCHTVPLQNSCNVIQYHFKTSCNVIQYYFKMHVMTKDDTIEVNFLRLKR